MFSHLILKKIVKKLLIILTYLDFAISMIYLWSNQAYYFLNHIRKLMTGLFSSGLLVMYIRIMIKELQTSLIQ